MNKNITFRFTGHEYGGRILKSVPGQQLQDCFEVPLTIVIPFSAVENHDFEPMERRIRIAMLNAVESLNS